MTSSRVSIGVTPTPRARSTTAPPRLSSQRRDPQLGGPRAGPLPRPATRRPDATAGSTAVASGPVEVSPEDHLLAAELATRAGLRLLALRDEGHPTDELRALGDAESNRYLVAALAAGRPDDGLLSEESVDDLKRLARRRVWIVDPLDGT